MRKIPIVDRIIRFAQNRACMIIGVLSVLGTGMVHAGPPASPTLMPTAAQPGATVIISGKGFGAFISTQENQVRFKGVPALIQQWESDLIMVKVPLRAQDGPVTLLVGESTVQAGTFTVHQPKIDRMAPFEAEAGSLLIIEGKHFGNTAGSRDPNAMFGVNQVLINEIPGHIKKWRPTKIEVQIPATAKSGDVIVRLASYDPLPDGSCCAPVEYAASNSLRLTVIAPIAMQPTEGTIGSKVVLSGLDFGKEKGKGDAVLFNGHPATIARWSSRNIVVHVPLHATSGALVVRRDGVDREIGRFKVHTFQVSDVSSQEGPIGSLVRIRGAHFGLYSESGETPYWFDFNSGANAVEIGGVPAIIHRWHNDLIDVWVPYSAKSGEIVIKRGATIPKPDGTCCADHGVVEVAAGFFTVVTPTVKSYGPASAGLDDVVTIKGSGFGNFLKIAEAARANLHQKAHTWKPYRLGANVSRTSVLINGIAAQVVSWNNTEIQVRVPRRPWFGIATPEGFDTDRTTGEVIMRRGSWDALPDGTCCTEKRWVSTIAGPFKILDRGIPDQDYMEPNPNRGDAF